MTRGHYQLNGRELEQTLGDSGGQGSLVCCSPWDRKESDMTEQLNNSKRFRITVSPKKINRWSIIT